MGVELVNLGKMQQRFVAIESGALQTALVTQLHNSAAPIRADMLAKATTRIQHRAMDAVEITKRPDGLEFLGNAPGHGLGTTLFNGAEFGGRSKEKKKVPGYVFGNIVRNGSAPRHYVLRRTTMMFLQWRLGEPYFFHPTLAEWEPKLVAQAAKTVADFVGGV